MRKRCRRKCGHDVNERCCRTHPNRSVGIRYFFVNLRNLRIRILNKPCFQMRVLGTALTRYGNVATERQKSHRPNCCDAKDPTANFTTPRVTGGVRFRREFCSAEEITHFSPAHTPCVSLCPSDLDGVAGEGSTVPGVQVASRRGVKTIFDSRLHALVRSHARTHTRARVRTT